MKKYFFLFLMMFFLTACSSTNDDISKDKPNDEYSKYDIKTNKQNDEQNNNEQQNQDDIINKEETMQTKTIDNNSFEDLTKEYSQAIIKTNQGDITVKFYSEESPKTVNNFLNLAKLDFYDGVRFHRVIKDFMIQSGDPLSKSEENKASWGTGGPGYRFADEFNEKKLVKGSLAMANSGTNTNGSQFFIVTAESTPWLDGRHTNFGEVVAGIDIVEKIEQVETSEPGKKDAPVEDMIILDIELIK